MTEKTHMIYWHPGMIPPATLPEWCDLCQSGDSCWVREPDNPGEWQRFMRRWPATQAEYRAWHWCQAHGVMVPEGYEVVDFRIPVMSDVWLMTDGDLARGDIGGIPRPILRKIEIEQKWRPATDADKGKKCRFRDVDTSSWASGEFIATWEDKFIACLLPGRAVDQWCQCEVQA